MEGYPTKAPLGFKTLAEADLAPTQTVLNVIGVVVDYLQPSRTKGTDWSLQLGLLDPSFSTSFNQSTGFKVRYFAAEDKLPKISGLGDVVLLRGVKKTEWSGAPMLLSSRNTQCLSFWGDAFKGKAQPIASSKKPETAPDPTGAEVVHLLALRKWAVDVLHLSTSGVMPAQPAPLMQRKDKFTLLKDAKDFMYCDILGEVIKTFPGGVASLHLTDYTPNPDFWNYEKVSEDNSNNADGDPFGYTNNLNKSWKGPPGKLTVQLSLWHPHNEYVTHHVKEKDIVYVRNVHMKISKGSGILEGKLHTDKMKPDEVGIRIMKNQSDKRYSDFLQRRKDFYEQQGVPIPQPGLGKQKNKKPKNTKRKAERQAADAAAKRLDTGASKPDGNNLAILSSNTHVVCANPTFQITPLSLIGSEAHRKFKTPAGNNITLPFVNRKCKIRIRVVDFFPPNLEDFAQSIEDSSYNNISQEITQSEDSTCITDIAMSNSSPRNWEWSFFLWVEDASRSFKAGQQPERLRILVSQQDADYLLKLDATDLRHDKKTLAQLKEKLFILWGNLEELKTAGDLESAELSSNPFDCWVKEYGIPSDDGQGWERMFKLSQTTIK